MNDSSFIDLLSDYNIERINIDPRLVESLRRNYETKEARNKELSIVK